MPQKFDDDEFREKFSRIVNQEVHRIQGIVQDLLVFSKPAEPKPQRMDVNEVLKQIGELLSSEILKQRIEVEWLLEEADVMADRDQIKQALLNIIMNAMDATKPNGGKLVLKTNRREDGLVCISIADTGKGIPANQLPHIFDPFFSSKDGGTGLGLAITHSIIEKNKGKIFVQSEIGKGTTFTVQIPGVNAG